MNEQALSPRIENAIAAAAAASFYLLRPVSADQDQIRKALVWQPEAEQWDEEISTVMDGFDLLSRFVVGGDPSSLWRYLFFELAVNPAANNCDAVLRS